jgi:hypothetical protein
MSITLKEVTLVCFDTRNANAAIESMRCSLTQVKFSKNVLFTTTELCSIDIKEKAEKLNIKLECVSEIKSISDYSYFVLAKLDNYISTKFCLITQWDSWVINHNFWDSNFLNYDYIGAVWPHYLENQVGNGGFSLRSKKLLKASKHLIKSNSEPLTPLIEDDYICRQNRSIFEKKYKIKFPTNRLANKFSIEGNGPPINSFGFHGMSNFHLVIKKDIVLKNLLNRLSYEYFTNRESYDLTKSLLKENRFTNAKLIIQKRFYINGLSKKHIKLYIFLFTRITFTKVTQKVKYWKKK